MNGLEVLKVSALQVLHSSLAFEKLLNHIQCKADDNKKYYDSKDSCDHTHGDSPFNNKQVIERRLNPKCNPSIIQFRSKD